MLLMLTVCFLEGLEEICLKSDHLVQVGGGGSCFLLLTALHHQL